MSKTKTYDERIEAIKKALQAASEERNEHASYIDKRSFKKHAKETVTEWDLRSVGGFAAIKKELFPLPDEEIIKQKKNQLATTYINKLQNTLTNSELFQKTLLEDCVEAVAKLEVPKYKKPKIKKSPKGRKMTMEALLSDIHYGKKTKKFNLKILRQRMEEFRDVFLAEMSQKEKTGFDVEKIIVALIGDIIESFTMHGIESAMSCEFGNAEQVQSAIVSLFHDFLRPVAMTGKDIVVIGISGNHDRTDKDKTFNNPGRIYMTWVIYNMLKELCTMSGLDNVSFIIPDESYLVYDIYHSPILYEHGDKLKNTAKNTIENKMASRSRQAGRTIHMARFGHWHEYHCYDRGRAIINESVPGPDSYAQENGYMSTPGQTINFYIETDTRPTSFYYSFPVFLG